MRAWRELAAAGAALLAITAVGAAYAPAAGGDLPVPWTAAGAGAQAGDPDTSPAGSNDWSCEPSARHRHPVILVHGLGGTQAGNWGTMSPFLANRGFCVFSLTYGTKEEARLPGYQFGGVQRMQRSSRELKDFVGRVLEATGARKVDIVGHSEGSLMPNWYVKFRGGARHVDDYVGVTPIWDGTTLAGLSTLAQMGEALGFSQLTYDALAPYCESCPQFLHGSHFLRRMNEGGAAVAGVDYTMIMTRNDELVIPYTSGRMDGARNLVVQEQCALDQSEHLSVIFDPITAYDILNALDRKHPKPVPCTLVLPLIGAPTYSGD
jgi:triacylglycerol lipase